VNKKQLVLNGVLTICLLTTTVIAQQLGESVSIDQPLFSDQYLAGLTVRVNAPIQGDLVVAGQELVVDAPIGGDLIAAGESLNLRNSVSDDVRAAGRTLTLDAEVMGHAVAAGAEVILTSDASVGDWAWFAGQSVMVEGEVGEELRAAGQSVMVSGEIGGDAVLAAEEIQIQPGAIIRGDLIWDSETEPEISANATVEGEIIREDLTAALEEAGRFGESGGPASAVLLAIALIAASYLAFLVFPGFSGAVAVRIRSMPFRSLGLGVVLMLLLAQIPLLGTIVLLLVLFSGLGAISGEFWQRYRQPA
jgi:cytoskeletal protein CcmA (bactofilin family)